MAKTRTSFTSESARKAGKKSGTLLLKKKGTAHFRKLAKLMWKKRRAKVL